MLYNGDQAKDSVKWGRLENGFRYALHSNPEAKGQASLRLIILAGQENDEPNLEGSAHLVEHLAFSCAEGFPQAELVDFFETNGIELSEEINAFTGPNHTLYNLDFPTANEGNISQGLSFFSNLTSKMNFEKEAVKRERELVRLELLMRKARGVDEIVELDNALFKTTNSTSDGLDALANHTPESLKRYWEKWYTPENTILFISSDIDRDTLEQLITERFKDHKPKRVEASQKAGLQIRDSKIHFAHHNLEMLLVQAHFVSPKLDFFERESASLRGLSNIINSYVQGFISGDLHSLHDSSRIRDGRIISTFTSRNSLGEIGLRNALYDIDKTIYAANRSGFKQEDLELLAQKIISKAKTMDEHAHLFETPSAVANEFIQCVIQRRPFNPDQGSIERFSELMLSINEELVLDYVKEFLSPQNIYYTISFPKTFELKEKQVTKTLKKIRRLYDKSQLRVAPQADQEELHSDTAGEIKKQFSTNTHDIKIDHFVFKNNIQLNLCSANQGTNQAFIELRVGDGLSSLNHSIPAGALLAHATLGNIPAASDKPDTSLHKSLRAAGLMSIDAGAYPDSYYIQALANDSREIGSFFSTTSKWLNNPIVNKSVVFQSKYFLHNMTSYDQSSEATSTVERELLQKEHRLRKSIHPQEIAQVELEQIESWLLPALENGFCEVSIYGDFDHTHILDQFSKTLGTLSVRKQRTPKKSIPSASYPKTGLDKTTYDKNQDLAFINMLWKVQDANDWQRIHELQIIDRLLSVQLFKSTRQEKALSYTSQSEVFGNDIIPDSIAIRIDLACAPSKERETLITVLETAQNLHSSITEERLDATIQGYQRDLQNERENNSFFWVQHLSPSSSNLEYLDSIEDLSHKLSRKGLQHYQDLAKDTLKSYKVRLVTARPRE